jgi:uncharacterized membrane protein YuzA (DUF378 family)
MKTFKVINLIAFILLCIGGIAWLTLGLFDANIVNWISFNSTTVARIIYALVGLSTLWLIFSVTFTGRLLFPWQDDRV